MSSLADRQREHDLPHLRTVERQILDALLRIEELLRKPETTAKAEAAAIVEERVVRGRRKG